MAPIGNVIVIGGGCYGRLHARRLLAAKRHGRVAFETLVVVDHAEDTLAREALGESPGLSHVQADWDAFLADHLADPAHRGDVIIPAPFAPHLLLTWLERSLAAALPDRAVARERVTHTVEQPYARHGADGGFYVSFADWACPVSCREPATCPAIRAPRTWEQSTFWQAYAEANPAVSGLATFVCRHLAGGVGAVTVAELLDARDRIEAIARASSQPCTFLVATVSACHGALGQLAVDLRPAAQPVP